MSKSKFVGTLEEYIVKMENGKGWSNPSIPREVAKILKQSNQDLSKVIEVEEVYTFERDSKRYRYKFYFNNNVIEPSLKEKDFYCCDLITSNALIFSK